MFNQPDSPPETLSKFFLIRYQPFHFYSYRTCLVQWEWKHSNQTCNQELHPIIIKHLTLSNQVSGNSKWSLLVLRGSSNSLLLWSKVDITTGKLLQSSQAFIKEILTLQTAWWRISLKDTHLKALKIFRGYRCKVGKTIALPLRLNSHCQGFIRLHIIRRTGRNHHLLG